MNYVVCMLVLLGASASAGPARPTAEFDAKVTAVGDPALLICGRAAATQAVTFEVTRVKRGAIKVGDRGTLSLMTCVPGKLLVPSKTAGVELDPARVRPGTLLHVDAESRGNQQWFATVDTITVTKVGP
jgi:hypothetical protein